MSDAVPPDPVHADAAHPDAAHPDPVQAVSLLRMANQIASNAVHKSHDDAVALVATHLRDFWAPSMRVTLTAWMDAGGEGLDPLAREALQRLRTGA